MPRVRSSINKVPNIIRAAAAELVKRSAMSHVSVSQQLAPVRTGTLRDGIRAEQKSELTWDVISSAPYSAFVEFGTVNMDAQPFFLPGYESAQRQLKEEAQQVLAAQLARLSVGV